MSVTTTEALMKKGTAVAHLDPSFLTDSPLDWVSKAEVLIEDASGSHLVFGGYVESVTTKDGHIVVRMVDGSQVLDDPMIVDLHARAVVAPEMAWTIARLAGFPPENIPGSRVYAQDRNLQRHSTDRRPYLPIGPQYSGRTIPNAWTSRPTSSGAVDE